MLVKRKSLKKLTIEEINYLVHDINSLFNNLRSDFKNSKKVILVSDDNNWEGDHLFKDIVLHNVLDITPICGGQIKDFKAMLKKRWKDE